MKTLIRLLALILAVMTPLCACSCGNGNEDDPKGTDVPADTAAPDTVELTDAQTERVKELSEALYLFGECDAAEGLSLFRIEEMVYCWYTGRLSEDPETPGYGRVEVGEAAKAVASIFKGVDISGALHKKYDPDADQEFYFKDGAYCVRLSEGEKTVEIKSVKPLLDSDGKTIGVTAETEVKENGDGAMLVMDLHFDEDAEFSLINCRVMLDK